MANWSVMGDILAVSGGDNKTMPKGGGVGFYAVAVGRVPGIYSTWAECQAQTTGFSKAKYKKFPTNAEAQAFVTQFSGGGAGVTKSASGNEGRNTSHAPVTPKAKTGSYLYGGAMSLRWGRGARQALTNLPISGLAYPRIKGLDIMFGCFRDAEFSPTAPRYFKARKSDTIIRDITEILELNHSSSGNHGNHSAGSGKRVVIYTDGSCLNQGKAAVDKRSAGAGVFWGPGDPRNISERLWGGQTNQRAELWAAVRGIQGAIRGNIDEVEIKTDSTYTIKGVTEWTKKWRKNGYCTAGGDPVKNSDLFKLLDKLCTMVHVQWTHVKAHNGEPGNEAADHLAKEGAGMVT
eukprot:sb/3466256/